MRRFCVALFVASVGVAAADEGAQPSAPNELAVSEPPKERPTQPAPEPSEAPPPAIVEAPAESTPPLPPPDTSKGERSDGKQPAVDVSKGALALPRLIL